MTDSTDTKTPEAESDASACSDSVGTKLAEATKAIAGIHCTDETLRKKQLAYKLVIGVAVELGVAPDEPLLNWQSDIGGDDNTFWEAPSSYHHDGFPICFRLTQVIIQDSIHWEESHDSELLQGTPNRWKLLSAAMGEIEQCELNIRNAL